MEDVTSSTSGKYKSCEGPIFKKGCKDPNTTYKSPDTEGTIYKVQGCIGTIQDGYFGNKTETALLDKTGKKEFDIDEVGNICKDFKSTDEKNSRSPNGAADSPYTGAQNDEIEALDIEYTQALASGNNDRIEAADIAVTQFQQSIRR